MRAIQALIIIVVLLALAASSFLFTVDERQYAIKLRLGSVERSDYEPGLHFKWPVVNNIRKFDKRLQTADLPEQQFLTSEQKYMMVDSFAKWRINSVVDFFTATGGNYARATSRLNDLINNALKVSISKHTIQQAISDERNSIMQTVQEAVNKEAQTLGIEVTDVRIKRLDFPDNVRGKVFERMTKDREKVARELRANGEKESRVIVSKADRERQEILANAYREAEELRGAGDASAASIYANAYGADRDFYTFYRSLNAYKNSFQGSDNVLVLEPDSEFFKYFNSSTGKQ